MSVEPWASDLLFQFLALRRQGQMISVEAFCAGRPELIQALREQVQALEDMEGFRAGTGRGGDNPAPPDGGTPDDSAHGLTVPLLIPGYEVLGRLGRGGMGIVYLARQVGLDRLVALKTVRGGRADPEEAARFRSEAQAAARLHHPHIVQIHEVGEHAGVPFFSMEHCDGGTLRARLADTTLSPTDAAQLVEQLAGAVQHAHDQGIIHRDLKPANILLQKLATDEHRSAQIRQDDAHASSSSCLHLCSSVANSFPKIADFGLAKKVDEPGLTVSGAILGTPSYMAPEQARGDSKHIGPAADVYALGAILYECLTGRPPFRAATPVDTVLQVLHDEPVPPRQLQPKTPRDLDTICLKCLHKDPARRYGSAGALAADLRRVLNGEPITARPVGWIERTWRWCRRNPAAAALVLTVALALLVIVPGALLLHLARTVAAAQRYAAAVSQARHEISRAALGWSERALKQVEAAAALSTPIRDARELRSLAVACLLGTDLGQPTVLLRDFRAGDVAVSPEGRTLAVAEHRASVSSPACAVLLLDLANGQQRRLTFPAHAVLKDGQAEADDGGSVAFSPDCRRLVVGARSGWLHLWDRERFEAPAASWEASKVAIEQLLFAPDGRGLLTCTYEGIIKGWDPSAPGKELLADRAIGWCLPLALNPAGTLLARAIDKRVDLLDPDTLLPRRQPLRRDARAVAFSPDGRQLAIATGNAVSVLDVETGSEVRRLSDPRLEAAHVGTVHSLEFNRDGSLLLSVCEDDRKCKLWDVASGRLAVTLMPGAYLPLRAHFTPAGDALVVAVDQQVRRYPIGGRSIQTTLAQHSVPLWDCAFPGDGHWLAGLAAVPAANGPAAGSVTLWDVASGRRHGEQACTLDLNLLGTPYLAGHPQSGLLALGKPGTGITQWDWNGGQQHEPWKVPCPELLCGAPDGKCLWGVVNRGEVCCWEWASGRQVAQWQAPGRPAGVWSLAVGKQWVLAGGQDGATRLLRADRGRLHAEWVRGPLDDGVTSVALGPDESIAASGTQQGRVRLTRLPGGEPLAGWEEHRDRVQSMAFSPDGVLLAAGSRDGTLSFYVRSRGTFEPLLTVPAAGPVQALRFGPDGRTLAVLAYRETAVRLWHLDRLRQRLGEMDLADPQWPEYPAAASPAPAPSPTAEPSHSLQGPHEMLEQAYRLREHGNSSAALLWVVRALEHAGGDASLERYLRTYLGAWKHQPALLAEIPAHGDAVCGVAFDPGGRVLATAGEDRRARLWDLASYKETAQLSHPDGVRGATFTRDGKLIVTWARQGGVRLWDAQSGQPIGEALPPHNHAVDAVALHPDGKRLAIGCRDGCIRLWDWDAFFAKDPTPVTTLDLGEWVTALGYSPDGKRLLSGSKGKVQCWDLQTLRPISEPLPHADGVDAALYSLDGRTFVTTTTSVARLWDAQTLVPIGVPMPHREHINGAVFSPDGWALATAGLDDRALLWDAASCRPLGLSLDHPTETGAVAIHPDGTILATGCKDGKVRLWGPLPRPITGDVRRIALWAQQQTGMELTSAGRLQGLTAEATARLGQALAAQDGVPRVAVQDEPPRPVNIAGADDSPRVPRAAQARPGVGVKSVVTVGGNGKNEVGAITVDAVGNVFVMGHFGGRVDFGPGKGERKLNGEGPNNTFVAKYTAGGSRMWLTHVGPGFVLGSSLAVDREGNTYVAGSFQGEVRLGTDHLKAGSGYGIFLAKLDKEGKVVRSRQAGVNSEGHDTAVTVDAAGGVYLAGHCVPEPKFHGVRVPGRENAFAAKLDRNLEFEWVRLLGHGTNHPQGRGIAVDDAGTVYVTGIFQDSGEFGAETLTSAGHYDIFVTTIDREGKPGWSRRYGGRGEDQVRALAVDRLGRVWIAGHFAGPAQFGLIPLTSAGKDDLFVAQLNPADGDVRWARRGGGDGYDQGWCLCVDDHGEAHVAGYFSGTADFDDYQLRTTGDRDGFVAKLDGAGRFAWAYQTGCDETASCQGVALTADGGMLTGGRFEGGASFDRTRDDLKRRSAGLYDAFLVRLQQPCVGGRIVREDNGAAVAGVVVELFDATKGTSLGLRVTDERGEYRFAGPRGAEDGYHVAFRLPPGWSLVSRPGLDAAAGRSARIALPPDGRDIRCDVALSGKPAAFTPPAGAVQTHRDGDGNVYHAGLFSREVDLGPGPGTCRLTSNGGLDVFMAKYTAAGTLVWARSWGGPADEELTALAPGPAGGIVVRGTFRGNVDFDPGSGVYLLLGHDGRQPFETVLDGDGHFVAARRPPRP